MHAGRAADACYDVLQQADDGERQLGWYNAGHRIALDIARGLHFLHSLEVRTFCSPCSCCCLVLAAPNKT
jgi:hypothetical protein